MIKKIIEIAKKNLDYPDDIENEKELYEIAKQNNIPAIIYAQAYISGWRGEEMDPLTDDREKEYYQAGAKQFEVDDAIADIAISQLGDK